MKVEQTTRSHTCDTLRKDPACHFYECIECGQRYSLEEIHERYAPGRFKILEAVEE